MVLTRYTLCCPGFASVMKIEPFKSVAPLVKNSKDQHFTSNDTQNTQRHTKMLRVSFCMSLCWSKIVSLLLDVFVQNVFQCFFAYVFMCQNKKRKLKVRSLRAIFFVAAQTEEWPITTGDPPFPGSKHLNVICHQTESWKLRAGHHHAVLRES